MKLLHIIGRRISFNILHGGRAVGMIFGIVFWRAYINARVTA